MPSGPYNDGWTEAAAPPPAVSRPRIPEPISPTKVAKKDSAGGDKCCGEPGWRQPPGKDAQHTHWLLKSYKFLQEVFGENSLYYRSFVNIQWSYTGPALLTWREASGEVPIAGGGTQGIH